jgi:hypothetical protein
MKTSTLLTIAAVAAGSLVAYSVFASLPSPAEARLDKLLIDKSASASDAAQMKAAWKSLSAADKATFDEYVRATDKASNAAEMTAAMEPLNKSVMASEASKDKNAYAIGLALYMSYTDKRVSFGLPSH